jgi:4-aminobutyrate aminotransferase/(S)-3-amino-2-methylpropionate transaminase
MVLTAGTYGNVIRLLPPLVMSDELITDAMDVITDAILTEAAK